MYYLITVPLRFRFVFLPDSRVSDKRRRPTRPQNDVKREGRRQNGPSGLLLYLMSPGAKRLPGIGHCILSPDFTPFNNILLYS